MRTKTAIQTISPAVLMLSLLLLAGAAHALRFELPPPGQDVVGKIQVVKSLRGDTISSLARRYDMGYYEIVETNPALQNMALLPAGTTVVIPSRFILPPQKRKGLIVNLTELRLYYFPKNENAVYTYPLGIGRVDWQTPQGMARITNKRELPTWNVPKSIREARAKDGVFLPKKVPPGPENPLGEYSMRLSMPGILLHGTNQPDGVGRRSSSGCLRMYPEDIEALFPKIAIGTPVNVVHSVFKVGWMGDHLFLESHLPLEEEVQQGIIAKANLPKMIKRATRHTRANVDWGVLDNLAHSYRGIPFIIGQRMR